MTIAGEAVSQLQEHDNVQIGYTVRELHITNAMLLHDHKHTEVCHNPPAKDAYLKAG
jgi:hypothetical protein